MKKLEGVAEVMVGQIMTRVASKDGEGEEVRVIVPGAVEEGYLAEESLGTNKLFKEMDSKFYTKAGDLVMKLTADYDVSMIKEGQEGLAISSFICVIRPKGIDAGYLCAVLNSRSVKAKLAKTAEAAIRPMIKVSDIRSLEIPILSKKEQEELGNAYMLSKEKIMILKELIDTEKEVMSAVIDKMVKEEN